MFLESRWALSGAFYCAPESARLIEYKILCFQHLECTSYAWDPFTNKKI